MKRSLGIGSILFSAILYLPWIASAQAEETRISTLSTGEVITNIQIDRAHLQLRMLVGRVITNQPEIFDFYLKYKPRGAAKFLGKQFVELRTNDVSFSYRDSESYITRYYGAADLPYAVRMPREILIFPNSQKHPGLGAIRYFPEDGRIVLPKEMSLWRDTFATTLSTQTYSRGNRIPVRVECLGPLSALLTAR